MIQMVLVKLHNILTDQQVGDILTKPLEKGKFEAFKKKKDFHKIPSSLEGSVESYSLDIN
jgi:hypothetical protein